MSNKKPSIPKGTRDFTPIVMCRRNYILETVKNAFERYSYVPIETPAMENTSTLTGKYGDEGDKLIFRIINSGDFLAKTQIDDTTDSKTILKDISDKALRYDLTVPFARFVVQNRNEITFPFKRYQMQNVWRADKPQKGRYREFFQCDADFIGTDSLLCEVELIQLYDDVFTNLNIPNVEIAINNRKILSGMVELMGASNIFENIVIILDKISLIGLERVKEEMLKEGLDVNSISILESFLSVKSIYDLQPLLEGSEVGKEGLEELQFIVDTVTDLGLQSANLIFDITLARGIDYYTGSILEVKNTDIEIGSIGGGGRYDSLTANFGIDGLSGVGISFGIDRIYLVMNELALFPDDINLNTKVLFMNFGEKESKYCLPLLKELRLNGISSELYPTSVKLKKQMNYANNKGVQYVVLVGENEINTGLLSVKNMATGEQQDLTIDQLISEINLNA